ncbi:MSHA biogenesis protein MshI [Vibrio aestuarianus]|uniref:MSHA biogenesis protein MshI n=1 Tax=Vibrio aestuarianus TaxID=28171 RepID=A0A9X4FEK8_9VIBR|nr:MSHA biogenesis protein MshI [Vibrio aestuarianus]MDE1235425.1 MSHA biogenesis protein MshI [Vibrio aestuarianus]MDE1246321.1 MSHA biogenesis protein MshI [Vibrio aestuarianus]MDE1346677.1 MSHA biogenesis protein MshI [Vibrio aestuarianus]NGZ63422.1 MSHA biogenesis protein MshI [Vibrio aestuarianus subsp. cardii]
MNVQSLIEKIKPSKAATKQLFVVVQPEAIYFSSLEGFTLPREVPLEGATWQSVLLDSVKGLNTKGLVVHLVLHSNLYQTYQIEKPNLPKEEWSVALPFLLKDLITEKVTEIVADAFPLPIGNKIQAYVVAKRLVLEVSALLQANGLLLGKVIPESEVWARSAGELGNFLLLHRNKNSSFKFDAFIDRKCSFQRTMRGVVAPITGVASSALQLDGLALELQRSIDYLSSQLKGASLHQLKVQCDEEDQQELVDSLNERLSVKVSLLDERYPHSVDLLIEKVTSINDEMLNLYPDHLKPKKDYFSLSAVAAVWGGVALLMLLMYGGYQWQNQRQLQQLQMVQSEAQTLKVQFEQMKQKADRHKPSADKIAAIERLKLEIKAKQDSLSAVHQFDESQQVGYSGVMRSLAKLSRNDISLTSIEIHSDMLDLHGLAREAKVIPNWLSQFKSELNLVGRSFEKLKIGRNEQDIITFELKTTEGDK